MGDDRLTSLVASTARELLVEPDVQHTLQRGVELAAQLIDHQVCASVSLAHRGGKISTPASTDGRALRADELQYELREGPCLDAIWRQETFSCEDLADDPHYPRWGHKVAEETGLRSVLSFQLFTSSTSLGALNLYRPTPGEFSASDRDEGAVMAAQVAVALRSAQTEEQLHSAVATRNLIGQAQGILMERYQLTGEQAFALLRRVSQDSNVKLRDVADRLVTDRRTPGT